MKSTISLLSLLFSIGVCAQTNVIPVTEAINLHTGVIYSLPRTVINAHVKVTKSVSTPGPYFKYAEKYLGLTDVITEPSTCYALTEVTTSWKSIADTKATYFVEGISTLQTNSLGVLRSINASSCIEEKGSRGKFNRESKPTLTQVSLDPSVLTEEMLLATSDIKRAELMAKQIFRLRENKILLASGEADKAPAGDKGFMSAVQILEQTEQALLAYFKGIKVETTEIKTIEYAVDQPVERDILCRISKVAGVVDKKDVSGTPIYISIKPKAEKTLRIPAPEKGKRVGIAYKIPYTGVVEITDGKSELTTKEYPFPQLAATNYLAPGLFDKGVYKAEFNSWTGTLEAVMPANAK